MNPDSMNFNLTRDQNQRNEAGKITSFRKESMTILLEEVTWMILLKGN